MIKVCFFDIGNVLIFVSFERLSDNFAKLFSATEQDIVTFIEKQKIQTRVETGNLSETEVLHHFNTTFQKQVPLETFKKAMCDCFENNQSIEPIVLNLKQKYPLYLLSNTSPIHFEYLWKNFPILKHFDDKILSYEVQAMKPDEKMYHQAIKLANVKPDEILYIDDIKHFCEMAEKQQIQTHHFQSTHSLEKYLTTLNLLPI